MLNIGIVGNTEILEPYVKRIQKNKNVNVIGKASIGTSTQLNGFHFSIPEFNRRELIERADVLLVDNSSRLPFDMLCNIVKKTKHIFATEYLSISTDECAQLVKLANESGSVVQITNPYYYTPAIQWLSDTVSTPLFIDISKNTKDVSWREALYPILLMLTKITGISPRKFGATAFESAKNETKFANVRLEFGDASVVNINVGSQIPDEKFKIKVFSKNKFASLNFNKKLYILNNSPIGLTDYSTVNELDAFIGSILDSTTRNSNLEEYYIAMQLIDLIEKKITQFIAS